VVASRLQSVTCTLWYGREVSTVSGNVKNEQNASADWTHLVADPDLVSHLGELLQTYREASPDQREQALLDAMRKIKAKAQPGGATTSAAPAVSEAMAAAAAAPAPQPPPFEPDIFTPTWGQDRRKYPRIKCCVAVELQVDGSPLPVWGTLCNTSMGGGFVETATPVTAGSEVKLGLWLSSGKIWVKGLVLNGVVTQSTPSFGMRIKFGQLQAAERDALREFLRYVQSATREHDDRNGYLARLKR
jgi:PilZ domain